jgi:putative ABC transport system substrate-binding protein
LGRPCLLLGTQEKLIVDLAARGAIPVLYPTRDYALAGGLMSYGTDFRDSYRQCGIYAGRVIRGEKPADLPVQLSTKFEFVVNLKAAKAAGALGPQLKCNCWPTR